MLPVARSVTPAHFTVNPDGDTIVHAPSDSELHITAPAKVTITSMQQSLLDIADDIQYNQDENIDYEQAIENEIKSYYSFLE
jgi:hypothetical protein